MKFPKYPVSALPGHILRVTSVSRVKATRHETQSWLIYITNKLPVPLDGRSV